jgi:hypothetical protein
LKAVNLLADDTENRVDQFSAYNIGIEKMWAPRGMKFEKRLRLSLRVRDFQR